MYFNTVVTATAVVLAGLASASPLQPRQGSERFYLQTQVYPDTADNGTDKNNLFVYSYHTGAGLGAATVSDDQPTDSWFYLNGTDLLWTYEGSVGPWPVGIVYGAYQAFNPISISVAGGQATPGFFFNSSGLQLESSSDGWLACDWWYSTPQLFAFAYPPSRPIPASCSRVNLIAIPVA